jgi:hypothetical protein
MTNPNIYGIPLPSEEEYNEAVSQVRAHENIKDPSSMDAVVRRMKMPNSPLFGVMTLAKKIGLAIEPIDRSTGQYFDDTHATALAVEYGIAVGGLVVIQAHKDLIAAGSLNIALPFDAGDTDDEAHGRHTLAEHLIDYGGYGVAVMGAAAESQLTEVEEQVIINIKTQRRFRTGCGIIARAAFESHIRYNEQQKELDLAKLSKQVENIEGMTDDDWDAGLAGLLG